jgi:hypothetical protein
VAKRGKWPTKSRAARGYGGDHIAERKRWVPVVRTGTVPCAHCAWLIGPDEPWDLAHTPDRSGWLGPAHRYCNRADGARNSNAVQRVKRALEKAQQPSGVRIASREW